MFFRNATFFRFSPLLATAILHSINSGSIGECALKETGALEMSSRGFVPPFIDTGSIAHIQGDLIALTLGGNDRILPASVVNAEVHKRISKIEDLENRRLGGKARRKLKEDVIFEMVPRALLKPFRLDAYLDLKRGIIVINTGSRKAAENFVSELRHALGSFPAMPLNAEESPRKVMTGWLLDQPHDLPRELWIGDEVTLKEADDRGGVVKISRQDIVSDELKEHLTAGKMATDLGLTLGDKLSFVFDESLRVKKLKFLDASIEPLSQLESEDQNAELLARFTIMTGEIGQLFDVVEKAFKFSKVE